MIRNHKLQTVLIIMLSLLLVGLTSCGKKKKKTIEDIRTEFNKKPNSKYLIALKKHYKKENNTKAILEISEAFYKAFPNDRYIKTDIGKVYADLAKKEKGEKKLELLTKASSFGYTNTLLTQELASLVDEKIKVLEKNGNNDELIKFLEKTKKLPLQSKMRRAVELKINLIKNKAVFDKFYKPFRANIEKTVPALLATIFPQKNVAFDKAKGDFLLKSVAIVQKGDTDKNSYTKTKNIAYNSNLELFTVLKYALEHGKKPPVGKEFRELFFPKESFHCDSVVLSKDKKKLQLTCTANILDLGQIFFDAKKDAEESAKKEVKKVTDTKAKDTKTEKKKEK